MPRATANTAPKRARKPAKKAEDQRKPVWLKEGKRLKAILSERGVAHTAFARDCCVAYHNVYRWTRGFEFTEENQGIACAVLGIEGEALSTRDAASLRLIEESRREFLAARRRELKSGAVLKAFKRRPIAASLSVEQWNLIASIQFHDAALRPSVALYEAVAFALKGAIRLDEIASVAAENAELDRSLSHKGSLPRR